MIKRTFILAAFAFVSVLSLSMVFSGNLVTAQDTRSNTCAGAEVDLDAAPSCAGADSTGPTTAVNKLIANVVNLISLITGIVAVVFIVIGGFKYITSGGDSGKITSAKTTITYALIGLIIVALAQFIVRFVLGKAVDVPT